LALIVACLAMPLAASAEGPVPAFLEQRITRAGQVERLPAELGPQDLNAMVESGLAGGGLAYKLAFASAREGNWDLYTAEGDGSSPRQLTADSPYDRTPAWNRGATRLAFVSDRCGGEQLFSIAADGSDLTQLTWTGASELLPKWSPDGQRIAFYSSRHDASKPPTNYEIHSMDRWGSNDQRLTSSPGFDGHPTWSPDGTQIMFVSNRSGSYELWRMNADGSNQRQLSNGLRRASYPAWSPDGQWIACNEDMNGDGWLDLALIRPDGTGLKHPLGASPAAYDYEGPCWSPDGKNLAFTRTHYMQYGGRWYWVGACIWGVSLQDARSFVLAASDADAWPSWEASDTTPPSARVLPLSPVSAGPAVTISWTGRDNGPGGVQSFDVQVRDVALENWADWQSGVAQTSAQFVGEYGHTYEFRCRARDWAGNVGAYREQADTSTSIYRYALTGQVRNTHDQAVAGASVRADPAALRPAQSDWRGNFTLYFGEVVTCSLHAGRAGFTSSADTLGVRVPGDAPAPILYLRPATDSVEGGQFEGPTLYPWLVSGAVTLTQEAYSGAQAAAFGPGGAAMQSYFGGCLDYPASFSLLYRVTAGDPARDVLRLSLIGPSETYSTTVPLDVGGWRRVWCDMPACPSAQFSLRVELVQGDPRQPARVLIDEISLGEVPDATRRPVFLPLLRRALW